MDLILVVALGASPRPYTPPVSGIDENQRPIVSSVNFTTPTPPYTPPPSGVDQNRSPIVRPQTAPTSDPSESWEQKLLRRYQRKAS